MRASESCSSSLSCSRQLRTLFRKPRMEHLLKTTRSKVPSWRTKSKHYFFAFSSLMNLALERNQLIDKLKSQQIAIPPACVRDHRPCAKWKCVVQSVISHHDATPVGVPVNAMTTTYSLKRESVAFQSPDEAASRQAAWDTRQTLTRTAGSASSMVP